MLSKILTLSGALVVLVIIGQHWFGYLSLWMTHAAARNFTSIPFYSLISYVYKLGQAVHTWCSHVVYHTHGIPFLDSGCAPEVISPVPLRRSLPMKNLFAISRKKRVLTCSSRLQHFHTINVADYELKRVWV